MLHGVRNDVVNIDSKTATIVETVKMYSFNIFRSWKNNFYHLAIDLLNNNESFQRLRR